MTKPVDIIERFVQTRSRAVAQAIDRAFYGKLNLIEPRIQGAITKGKLRWRGVRVVMRDGKAFLYQRERNLGRLDPEDLKDLSNLNVVEAS